VLDKTGTITEGRPAVARIVAVGGMEADELLRLAAGAERYSEHPLARAVVQAAAARGLAIPAATRFHNMPGYGVTAEVEGRTLLVGSAALLAREGAAPPEEAATAAAAPGAARIHVAVRSDRFCSAIGTLIVADKVRPDSAAAIAALHRLGLRTVLLTGDNQATALEIARQVGIADVRAGVPPDGKAAVVRELQTAATRIAMVGDGINDAPALAQADLGVAMGGGSDIAKETGDIVLAGASLNGVHAAIRLSRATMRKIRQNLLLAFIYNVIAIPLAAFGMLNPYISAAAMALSDVTVIGNALLLRRVRLE
ncbi:MAG: HAD-IC family P-type ATPase, partial [Kiritimatiellae bacterium]|nr:HAD-IC family P-type ATPase [Kiritimatiellia bacterium]